RACVGLPGCSPETGETRPTRCACRGGAMRVLAVCSIAVSLVALPAGAQLIQGAVAPSESFSLQDDGTSLGSNPAGLGFVEGLEADFLHNGFYSRSRDDQTNALYLTGGTGGLALGLGFDWIRRRPCGEFLCPPGVDTAPSSYRRTTVGGALHLGSLSLGAVHRGFSGLDLSSWDFGALMRPWRWISLGAAVLDADRPGPLPRRWVVSTALRPWRENVDIAADLRWAECTNVQLNTPIGSPVPSCGFDRKDWIFTARARVARGLTLLGQIALLDRSRTQGMVGLQVDLGHVGASYAPVIGPGDPGDVWRIRASTERWPSLRSPLRQAVELDLKKALSHPRP